MTRPISPLPCPHCGGATHCEVFSAVIGYHCFIVHDKPLEKCENIVVWDWTDKVDIDRDKAKERTILSYNNTIKSCIPSELVME